MRIPNFDHKYTEDQITAAIELAKKKAPADAVIWQYGNGLYVCPAGTKRSVHPIQMIEHSYAIIEIKTESGAPQVVHHNVDPNGAALERLEDRFKQLSSMVTPKYFRDRKTKAKS